MTSMTVAASTQVAMAKYPLRSRETSHHSGTAATPQPTAPTGRPANAEAPPTATAPREKDGARRPPLAGGGGVAPVGSPPPGPGRHTRPAPQRAGPADDHRGEREQQDGVGARGGRELRVHPVGDAGQRHRAERD